MQSLRQLLAIVGEVLLELGAGGKRHQKNVVVGMDGADEPVDRAHGRLELVDHTPAGVEQNPYADGNAIVLTEMRNLLGDAVFFNHKIILREAAYVTSSGVCDCGVHVDE